MELALAPRVIVVNGYVTGTFVNESSVKLGAARGRKAENATLVSGHCSSDSLCFLHMRVIILLKILHVKPFFVFF